MFRRPEIVAGTRKAARAHSNDVTEVNTREALTRLDPLWDALFPAEQTRFSALLVARVVIGVGGMNVRLRTDGLRALAREITTNIGAAS